MSLENEEELQAETGIDGFLGESGEVEQSAADQAEDDDLAAGYASVNGGDDTQAGNTGESEEQAVVETPVTPEPTPEPTPAPVAKIGRWTEDEIAARFADLEGLKTGQAKVAGHIGDLRNRLQGQQPRKISAADLPKVVAEFGEEYAAAMADDLNAIGFGGNAGPSQAEIDKLIATKAEEIAGQQIGTLERKLNKREVLRAHRDADDHFVTVDGEGKPIVGKHYAAFKGFVDSLPAERQSLIANSWDPDVMTQALSDFKQSQKAPTATPAPTPAPAAEARANRVARAVTPRGNGSAAPPVGDPFLDGYKSAKAGH